MAALLATLGLLLLQLSPVAATTSTRDFAVPAVDFSVLATSAPERAALLSALQADGILALRNVPGYAPLRAKYLRTAAACAVTARDNKAEFLLYRKLTDGTERFTISTESGRKLGAAGDETLAHCPGYLAVYREFSELIESAVAGVGKALDATGALHIATGSDEPLTARELMEESVHLDHFHAYQGAKQQQPGARRHRQLSAQQLSLEMHTDNGLLIAMTAPEYFDVADSGEVRAKLTRSEDAGLVIQTAAGETVRPVLVADELVLMLGSGADQWVTTSPKLRPVMHGMRFPRDLSYADGGDAPHKVLRAWFGKMVLLNADHVMRNTGMSYGEYANHTTRYLMESNADLGFAAVACPPDRRLQASDNKCMTKVCTLKAGADTSGMLESCQVTCNHESTDDVKLCQQNCECETQSVAGHRCWMLCVADLPADVCPGAQKCNTEYTKSKLGMACVAPTLAPTTPKPSPSPSSSPSPAASATPTTTAKPSGSAGSASKDGNAKVSAAPINAGDSSKGGSASLSDVTSSSSQGGNSSNATSSDSKTSGSSIPAAMVSLSVGIASVLASAVLVLAQ